MGMWGKVNPLIRKAEEKGLRRVAEKKTERKVRAQKVKKEEPEATVLAQWY